MNLHQLERLKADEIAKIIEASYNTSDKCTDVDCPYHGPFVKLRLALAAKTKKEETTDKPSLLRFGIQMVRQYRSLLELSPRMDWEQNIQRIDDNGIKYKLRVFLEKVSS